MSHLKHQPAPRSATGAPPAATDGFEIQVPVPGERLNGFLYAPDAPVAAAVWAYPRHTAKLLPAIRESAAALAQAGFVTLLVGLLTARECDGEEQQPDENRLGDRFLACSRWLRKRSPSGRAPVGYLGMGSAGPAALLAAATDPEIVLAVVSGGGTSGHNGESPGLSTTPALFIVAGLSTLRVNRSSDELLVTRYRRLEIVASMRRELDDGEALKRVTALSASWFTQWLAGARG